MSQIGFTTIISGFLTHLDIQNDSSIIWTTT
jgi:hypothetical protein